MSQHGREPHVAGALNAELYSFGRSAHLTAEKSALYQDAAHQIAIDMSLSLSDWLLGFTVEAAPLIEADAGEDLHESPEDFDTATVSAKAQPCGSILTEFPLALALVTGLLGGPTMAAGEPRPLTSIERRVLDLVSATFIEAAAKTLLIDGAVEIDRSRDGAFAAGDDDESETRIGFGFRIHGPGGAGHLVLGFELWALHEFSDLIDARLSGRRAALPATSNPHTAAALQPVPVPFTVGLGRVSLTAREVVELQEGDVIRTRLAVDSDVIASVGNIDLFTVRLGQRGQQLTAEILSPMTTTGSLEHTLARTVHP